VALRAPGIDLGTSAPLVFFRLRRQEADYADGPDHQNQWANPHIHLSIDVKDETGRVIHWAIEMESPNMLIRLGWTRDAMKVGDVVTIEGHLARDGSKLANARTVSMAGKKMFAASSQGNTP
jgi:Family of unknown function (DUF6152)